MELKMFSDSMLNELKSNISFNKEKYQSNTKFVDKILNGYEDRIFLLNKKVTYPTLKYKADYDDSIKQWEIDFKNSIILYEKFIKEYNIEVKIWSDERFVAYLTHDVYYDYMQKRWPVKGKENRIKEKYFFNSNQAFTRNSFLRLFWYAFITYDEKAEDPYHLTRIAFEYADPVNQIMERKYSRNKHIVRAALRAIEESPSSKILNAKRTLFGKTINNILGLIYLDVINENDLVKIFKREILKITTDSYIDDSNDNDIGDYDD